MDTLKPRDFVVMDIDDPVVAPDGESISVHCVSASGVMVKVVLTRHVIQRCLEVAEGLRGFGE